LAEAVAPLRTFAGSEEAQRAWGWLRRAGLTPEIRSLDDGRVELEVPPPQRQRAEGILAAVAGMNRLGDLPPTGWWQRIFTWENAGMLLAVLVMAGLAVIAWLGLGGLVRYLGFGSALLVCVAGLVYVGYAGYSAANAGPERVTSKHGVVTQAGATRVSYERAFARQTWALVKRRPRVETQPEGGAHASSSGASTSGRPALSTPPG
jgi:hypothetical protein